MGLEKVEGITVRMAGDKREDGCRSASARTPPGREICEMGKGSEISLLGSGNSFVLGGLWGEVHLGVGGIIIKRLLFD